MNRKATQKMIDYAKGISEWVPEKMPDSDDFLVISSYINRNVSGYHKALERENYAYMASNYRGEYFDL